MSTASPYDGAERPRAATMSDVARLADVSLQTVSRVLNGHPYVTESTRRRVQEAVAQLRYRPNASARALVTRRTMALGLVSAGHSQWGPAVALFGIAEAAREAGYGTSVVSLGQSITRADMRKAFEDLTMDGVDGIVVIAPVDSAVAAVDGLSPSVPVVLFEPGADNGTTIVAIDEALGARLATRHLLSLGHRTVYHVSGPPGWLGTRARIAGWRAELASAGAVAHEVIAGDWSASSGYAAGCQLVEHSSATSVFVANDQMALGVLSALADKGRHVPEEVSVVGFDDVPEAAFYKPALTTVKLDFAEVGRRCVSHLLSMVGGSGIEPEAAIAPELIVRTTTAPPPDRAAAEHEASQKGRR